MTLSAATTFAVLAQLIASAVRTIALAAAAAALLKFFRQATSIRLFAWTVVLYAGSCMPVLGCLLHPLSIPLWWLPPEIPTKSVSENSASFSSVELPTRTGAVDAPAAARSRATSRDVKVAAEPFPTQGVRAWSLILRTRSIQWIRFAAVGYLAIAAFLLFRFIAGLTFAHRIVRSSTPIQNSRILLRVCSCRPLRRICARVHESTLVSVPVTIGVIAPTILLPVRWREWDDTKLSAVIHHEMSHIVRHDALSQYVSILYRAIFWFSPLAWWLHRQIADLAEQASDEAALAAGTERTQYARALLGFFQAVKHGPGRIEWLGVFMAKEARVERRLNKILAWRGDYPMRSKRLAIALVVAFAIPVIYVVAAVAPVSQGPSSPETTRTPGQVSPPNIGAPGGPQPPRSAPASPAVPPSPADGGAILNSGPPPAEPTGPVSPSTPEPPAPPVSPEQEDSANTVHHGFSYAYGFGDEQRFVIVSGKSNSFTVSGSSEDRRHAEKLRQAIAGDFIWFERDETSYIIRDQATVDRARQLFAPQEELGRKQAELGKQQEALGKQQEEIATRMQQVRVKVPDMTADLEKLKAELHRIGPEASIEEMGRIQAQIGELQAKLGQLQSHAGDAQSKLGSEMGALGQEQGRLGELQGELGRQQEELAQRATRAMKELLDDAIKKGVAQREPLEPGGASL